MYTSFSLYKRVYDIDKIISIFFYLFSCEYFIKSSKKIIITKYIAQAKFLIKEINKGENRMNKLKLLSGATITGAQVFSIGALTPTRR